MKKAAIAAALSCVLPLACAGELDAATVNPPPDLAAQPEQIRLAVQAAIKEEDARALTPQVQLQDAGSYGASHAASFARKFAEAKVPDCLRPDGLSKQSTNIGPATVVGMYAAPFVVIAKLRGKCN